jgi:TRAP-type C4-dicarboxylate transport system permease small subunit
MFMKFLNGLTAAFLAVMAVLVFGNVVLRYVFNSGITWSEEMARFLFIWLILIGSISALKDNQHLGVDMLVKRLPRTLKKIVYVFSNVLILYVLWIVFFGSWDMTVLNMDNKSPATGVPQSWIYGTGIFMSLCMAIIILGNLFKLFFGKTDIEDLTRTLESEEMIIESDSHSDHGGVVK